MSGPVDVLTILDRLAGGVWPYSRELSEQGMQARAAVAELIEAAHVADKQIAMAEALAAKSHKINGEYVIGMAAIKTIPRLRAALARLSGAPQ